MSDEIVWSSKKGDLRKQKGTSSSTDDVDITSLELHVRRITSGKGRTIIEITNLPSNKKWNQKLAKQLKKKLGIGGAFKNDYIEVHGEKLDKVKEHLQSLSIKFKQVGG